jgi:hypothetical protein
MCHIPQARQLKVASSGRPSNRAVRLASRMVCAQHGQRGGASVELAALVSHMIVAPGSEQDDFCLLLSRSSRRKYVGKAGYRHVAVRLSFGNPARSAHACDRASRGNARRSK